MQTTFKPSRSTPQNRLRARGQIVRTRRRHLCAVLSTPCRPKHNASHRSCARLGIISKDPIGFEAGDANLYRYVGNGPTNATDPTGLVETIGAETPPWYNDSGWVGTPVGTGVGTVMGVGSAYDSYWADKEIAELRRKYATENAGSINLCEYGDSYRLPQSQASAVRNLAKGNVEFYGVAAGLASGGLPVTGIGDDVVRHTAGVGRSVPKDDLGDVAFGLWRHQETRAGGLLDRFANHVGARTYGQIYDPRIFPTEEMLENMMRGANRLHVNLDGMCKTIDDLPSIVDKGSRGMDYVPPGGGGNITNWEIWRIHQDPEILARTTFYIDGKPVKP